MSTTENFLDSALNRVYGNYSEFEAESTTQAEALKALNTLRYFFTNPKGTEEHFKTVRE